MLASWLMVWIGTFPYWTIPSSNQHRNNKQKRGEIGERDKRRGVLWRSRWQLPEGWIPFHKYSQFVLKQKRSSLFWSDLFFFFFLPDLHWNWQSQWSQFVVDTIELDKNTLSDWNGNDHQCFKTMKVMEGFQSSYDLNSPSMVTIGLPTASFSFIPFSLIFWIEHSNRTCRKTVGLGQHTLLNIRRFLTEAQRHSTAVTRHSKETR